MASPTQQTKQANEDVRRAREQAVRSLSTVARNSAYAWIGAGDLAVSVVRNLGEKAAELRAEAPSSLRTGVDPREIRVRVERGVGQVRTDATREFDRLSNRGRNLVESIQQSGSTRKAFSQLGVAQSQVKAAATSVTKAADLLGDAAEDSVEKVGDDSPVDYDAKNLDELKEIARQRQIAGRSSMNRDELVKELKKS